MIEAAPATATLHNVTDLVVRQGDVFVIRGRESVLNCQVFSRRERLEQGYVLTLVGGGRPMELPLSHF